MGDKLIVQRIYKYVKHCASGAVLAAPGVHSTHMRTHVFVCVPTLAAYDEIRERLPHRYHLFLPTTPPSHRATLEASQWFSRSSAGRLLYYVLRLHHRRWTHAGVEPGLPWSAAKMWHVEAGMVMTVFQPDFSITAAIPPFSELPALSQGYRKLLAGNGIQP